MITMLPVTGLLASTFAGLMNFEAGNLGWVAIFSTLSVVNASLIFHSLND